MRDRLTALALSGHKRATAGLWKVEYEAEGEELDWVGERQVMLASDGSPAGVVEVTRIESYRFADVPWEFADAEGEGFTSIEDWRRGHRQYYGRKGVSVEDDDVMVCVWFEVVG